MGLQDQFCINPSCKLHLMFSNIRPRDKTSAVERERDRELRQSRSFNRDRSLPPQMMRPPMRNNGVSSKAFPPRFPENAANQAWSPYPLLSKTLTVANLPPDYTPKDLYELFSDFGKAEGAFVYAFPDMKGRRVGEVAMATYLIAQKVYNDSTHLTTGTRNHGRTIH